MGGLGEWVMQSALSMFRCQQDQWLRMLSPLGRRFMSLNYPFRGNRRDYGNELNCQRRAYSEERENLCLILCLRVREEAL